MKTYELAFIVKPNIDDEGVETIVEKISNFVVNRASGEIVATNIWGRRRLAYPIKKYREGTYVLFQANVPSSSVPSIERELNLSEEVIRFLMFKVEEN